MAAMLRRGQVALRARRGRRDDDGGRGRRCHARAVLDDRPADLVLRGGRIATMDPARADGRGAGGRRRADRRRRPGCGAPSLDRTAHAGHRPPRPDGHARLRRCPRPPGDLRPRPPALRPDRSPWPGGVSRQSSPRTPRRTRTRRGSAAAAGRWPTSRAASRTAPISIGSCPDRPVYLESRDGHTAWVNSVALARAGITATTPDPRDGRIERDVEGRAIGTLQEGARVPVQDILPADTDEELVAALRLAQAELHALGITNWQDAQVEATTDVAYTTHGRPRRAHARGSSARSAGTRRVAPSRSRSWSSGGRATARPRYAPTSVKFFADGILENFTGAVLEPYLDRDGLPTSNLRRQPDRARRLRCGRHPARCARVPGPRPCHRRSRRARRARRHRGRAAGQRHERYPAADRASPARPSGRPRAVPCARRRGRRPGLLGRARRPDGGADDPVRGSRTGRPDVSHRVAAAGRRDASRWARTGASRRRTRCSRWRWRSSA